MKTIFLALLIKSQVKNNQDEITDSINIPQAALAILSLSVFLQNSVHSHDRL